MSELEINQYCEVCKTTQNHLYSGSKKLGGCDLCLARAVLIQTTKIKQTSEVIQC